MGLRDALVSFEEDETPDKFMARAFDAAARAGGSGRLRLETGAAFSLSDGLVSAGVSLWVERGAGRSESWQRVTGTIMATSYSDALALFGKALDEHRKIRQEAK